jgi:hypothetical protein
MEYWCLVPHPGPAYVASQRSHRRLPAQQHFCAALARLLPGFETSERNPAFPLSLEVIGIVSASTLIARSSSLRSALERFQTSRRLSSLIV